MRITVISKNYGSQTINTDQFNPSMVSSSSPVFKIIEHMFNDWFDQHTTENCAMARDIRGMYFGEADQPAIYNRRGAIQQGIEVLIEIAEETKKDAVVYNTKQISMMDIESAFD